MAGKTLVAQFLVPPFSAINNSQLGRFINPYDLTMTVTMELADPRPDLSDVRDYVPEGWNP